MKKHKVLKIAFNLFLISVIVAIDSGICCGQSKTSAVINMVFSSDAHYGIRRTKFRGDSNVSSNIVNAAMIQQMNSIPDLTLAQDGGVNSGEKARYVD